MNIYAPKNFWILIMDTSSWICNLFSGRKNIFVYTINQTSAMWFPTCAYDVHARARRFRLNVYPLVEWLVSARSSTSAASWLELRGRLPMRTTLLKCSDVVDRLLLRGTQDCASLNIGWELQRITFRYFSDKLPGERKLKFLWKRKSYIDWC